MEKFQYYTKGSKVKLSNEQSVEWPQYVLKAKKNYRFDQDKQQLFKQCYKCKRWFLVAGIKNLDFDLMHSEDELHYHGNSFSSRCNSCKELLEKKQQDEEIEKIIRKLKENGLITGSDDSDVESQKQLLTVENQLYLKHLAVIKNCDEKQILNDIINGLRINNTIEIIYIEKIEKFW